MTISHAHARNACAHEQSTNIESGAVQWHKQLAERATFATSLSQSWLSPLAVLFVFKLVAKVFRTRLHAFA